MKNIFGGRKEAIILSLIFLLVFSFRLYFVIQSSGFSSDDAYFHYRIADSIVHWEEITYDKLSHGGKEFFYPVLFHYFLAIFGLVFPLIIVLKFIPELLISFLILVVYLISKHITGNKNIALIISLISGFLPLLYKDLLNQASIYSLVIPIFFFMVFCFMKMREEKQYLVYFVILTILFGFVHPFSFLLVLSLMIYSLIILSESWTLRRINKEAIIFAIFVIISIQFLIYKKIFLKYGLNVLWQNIPPNILNSYFTNFTILEVINRVGLIPISLGIIALYYGIFKEKNDSFYVLGGIILATLLLLLLKLIDFSVGLIFLGVVLTILSSLTLLRFMRYLHLTKFAKFSNFFVLIFVLFILLFSIVPSYQMAKNVMGNVPSKIDLNVLEWIRLNIEENATILAPLQEGHMITALTRKSNVVDDTFLMGHDVEGRVIDTDNLYKLKSVTQAIDLLNKYDVDYIFLSEKTKCYYNINSLEYAKDERCFNERKYENKLYQIRDC